jgi:hypothetical protein
MLIVNGRIDTQLNQLVNLRRVVLSTASTSLLPYFSKNITSDIEHLTVFNSSTWGLFFHIDFAQKIFSNGFPYLKSCCLSDRIFLFSIGEWTQSPSLRILKTGCIAFNIYTSILSSCPNLSSFRFWIPPDGETTLSTETHVNLKRMVMNIFVNQPLNEDRFYHYFSLVTKLEQLTIDLIPCDSDSIISIKNSDWFASVINRCFPMLRQFHCYVTLDQTLKIEESESGDLMNKFKQKFQRVHSNRYQSKIVVRFENKL